MTTPLHAADRWLERGHDVALATVIRTWGSAPRGPGSVMCISDAGDFEGSVSGGCVETAVIEEARGVLASGTPRLLTYGVTNEMAWEVGLACGGTVEVRVEKLTDRAALAPLLAALDRGPAVVRIVDLEEGQIRLYTATSGVNCNVSVIPPTAPDALAGPVEAALDADRSAILEGEGARLFLHVVQAPTRVIVVGAVHIAQALLPMLRAVGYDAVVVDPRADFATAERFPGTDLVTSWPDRAFEELGLDRRTGVVTVTHDPKLDDPALELALRSDVFYIGALGSRRTHARRVDRLLEAGFSQERIDRIHAPIGLSLGGRTPGEIAASIVAEIVGVARKGGHK